MKRLIIAAIWGGVIGAMTFTIEGLAGNAIAIPLMILIFPGLIGSMAITGNVHAFPITLAALLNGFIHTGLCWGVLTLIARVRTRRTDNYTAAKFLD